MKEVLKRLFLAVFVIVSFLLTICLCLKNQTTKFEIVLISLQVIFAVFLGLCFVREEKDVLLVQTEKNSAKITLESIKDVVFECCRQDKTILVKKVEVRSLSKGKIKLVVFCHAKGRVQSLSSLQEKLTQEIWERLNLEIAKVEFKITKFEIINEEKDESSL